MKTVTLRNLLQRSVIVVATAFLLMAVFASGYISVSKTEREEAKHEETVHATLAELLNPALRISDFMEIQRQLKLVTKKEVIYGLVTENGDLLLYDYADRPMFQQILNSVLTGGCSPILGKPFFFGGNRWRAFCTDLIPSENSRITDLPNPKLISIRTFPRLSLSWFDFLKIALPLSLLLVVSVIYLRSVIAKKILKPIEGLVMLVRARMHKKEGLSGEMLPKVDQSSSEIEELRISFNELLRTIQQHYQERSKFDQSMAMNQVALQVVHDIRSPLSSIQAALGYLENMKIEDPKSSDVLNLLGLSAKRLTGIADDLLMKYKGENAETKIIFSLHHILDELVGEYQEREEFKGVTFVKQYQKESIVLCGDRAKLQRAFGNIIKNGLEAMEGKGVMTLTAGKPNGQAEIRIADTGRGISNEVLTQILQGGFTEGKKDGHGIGMKVVKETIEEFGGQITAESEVGQGARFIISLPLSSTAGDQSRFTLALAPNPKPVLVVDDDAGLREQWRLIFKEHGIKTILCESYEDLVQQKINNVLTQTAVVDYHFDNSEKTGGDVVRYLQTQKIRNIVLCTAEYWKPSVQKLAEELQVRLCPKPLPKIEISQAAASENKGYKVLVLDDDPLVELTWKTLKEKMNIGQFYFYPNLEALIQESDKGKLDLGSLDFVFLDKNIEQSQYKVDETARYLKSRRVKKLILATGEGIAGIEEIQGIDHISKQKVPEDLGEFL